MIQTILALACVLQAPQGGDSAWKTYTSAAGFSALMPGPVNEQKQPPAKPGQAPGTMAIAKDGDTAYLVMKINNPTPIPAEKAEVYLQGVVNETGKAGRLISQKAIALAGHPGREFVAELKAPNGEPVVLTARFILTSPDVTFNMQVIWARSNQAPPAAVVNRFFDSLRPAVPAMANGGGGGRKLEFQPFAPPGGGFETVMPGQPKPTKIRAGSGPGAFTADTYECETVLGTYAVVVYQYQPHIGNAPPPVKAQMLARMCEAVASERKATVTQKDSGRLQGLPAHLAKYTFPIPGSTSPGVGEARAVMAGPRIYLLSVVGRQDMVDAAEQEKFFDAFKVTEAPRPSSPPIMTRRPPPGGAAAPVQGFRTPRAAWKRFETASGGFTVLMPGEAETKHEDEGILGAKEVELFEAEHGGYRYIVQYQDLPRTAFRRGNALVFRSARTSDEKIVKGKAVGEKTLRLRGATAGVSYQIESPGHDGDMARVRAYVAGSRLYQVIVAGPKDGFPVADSDRFFSSFHLKERN